MTDEELTGVLWIDTLPNLIVPRAALGGDLQVDVAVVGAGYTGLWSAYYLHQLDPALRIAVLDAHVAGFGGSGRNALQPARLVRGLAEVVERAGTPIYSMSTRRVVTDHGVVSADVVVWDEIGLADRETFEDARLRIFYGQRTADDRIVLGGMGYPYRFGSGTAVLDGARIHERLHRTLVWLFPSLAGAAITHRWGGVIGMPRDATPSVGLDRAERVAWGGGYTGEGVSAANLAGHTIAELICEQDTERTQLPWVGHRSRRWEPEPLRWLGVRGGERAAAAIDWMDRG